MKNKIQTNFCNPVRLKLAPYLASAMPFVFLLSGRGDVQTSSAAINAPPPDMAIPMVLFINPLFFWLLIPVVLVSEAIVLRICKIAPSLRESLFYSTIINLGSGLVGGVLALLIKSSPRDLAWMVRDMFPVFLFFFVLGTLPLLGLQKLFPLPDTTGWFKVESNNLTLAVGAGMVFFGWVAMMALSAYIEIRILEYFMDNPRVKRSVWIANLTSYALMWLVSSAFFFPDFTGW